MHAQTKTALNQMVHIVHQSAKQVTLQRTSAIKILSMKNRNTTNHPNLDSICNCVWSLFISFTYRTQNRSSLSRLSERQHLGAAGQQLVPTLQPTLHEHLAKVLCNEGPVVGLIEVPKLANVSIHGQSISQLHGICQDEKASWLQHPCHLLCSSTSHIRWQLVEEVNGQYLRRRNSQS